MGTLTHTVGQMCVVFVVHQPASHTFLKTHDTNFAHATGQIFYLIWQDKVKHKSIVLQNLPIILSGNSFLFTYNFQNYFWVYLTKSCAKQEFLESMWLLY